MKDFNAEGASATRVPHACHESRTCMCDPQADTPNEECPKHGPGPWPPRCEVCGRLLPWSVRDKPETRECENCGQQKPIEEMETVFARGHGETYQCIECRGGP